VAKKMKLKLWQKLLIATGAVGGLYLLWPKATPASDLYLPPVEPGPGQLPSSDSRGRVSSSDERRKLEAEEEEEGYTTEEIQAWIADELKMIGDVYLEAYGAGGDAIQDGDHEAKMAGVDELAWLLEYIGEVFEELSGYGATDVELEGLRASASMVETALIHLRDTPVNPQPAA
jgi:hypothetical protein